MKSFLLTILLTITSLIAFSQTLKVTGVTTNLDRIYDQQAKRFLGKSMSLTFYDNSVSVAVGPFDENLRGSGASYGKIAKDSEVETVRYNLKIIRTLNVITSAILTLKVQEKAMPYRSATTTITAKRF